jgi:hypothetical protein
MAPPTQTTPTPAADPSADPAALLWVETWDDPTHPGTHALRSHYVESFWLPILGPSSIMLLRLLADGLQRSPAGFTLDVVDTARRLGLGHRAGRNAPVSKTIARCCSFGATRLDNAHQLVVRPTLPPLTDRQLSRLPASLQAQHHPSAPTARHLTDVTAVDTATATTDTDADTDADTRRNRCRTLALSLLQLGEDQLVAEQQLHRWRFHPAMAYESVQWAAAQLAGPDEAA